MWIWIFGVALVALTVVGLWAGKERNPHNGADPHPVVPDTRFHLSNGSTAPML
jgi:hypothetical protein